MWDKNKKGGSGGSSKDSGKSRDPKDVRKFLDVHPAKQGALPRSIDKQGFETTGDVSADEREAALEDVYRQFPRLRERHRQLAGTLSGGERQMLAVGRALMSAPKLLMLDEPSLGLAPLVVRDIFAIIERLRTEGITILLIEQNARAALEAAHHAYVLETGSIALEGPAEQLAGDPRVIETYLGAGASA